LVFQRFSFGRILCSHFETGRLLFSADDRAQNRKRGNYAGDKSRMHLQNPFGKTVPVMGMGRKLPPQFLQIKTQ
jgi:hypothetical protein